MITIFQARHSGMDWRRGFHILFRTSSIHGSGYPHPGGYDGLLGNLTKQDEGFKEMQ
jgi:hypothetical protein